jgi:hypothetical protein
VSNPKHIKRTITELEGEIWGFDDDRSGYSPDLFTLRGRETVDWFSKWLTNRASWFLTFKRDKRNKIFGGYRLGDETVYYERRLLGFFSKLISFASSQIPIGSIVVLYYVKDIRYRFAIISVCAMLVTLCLILFTKVRPIDIFLVTAA